MSNPWMSLPEKPPFVLECDKHSIQHFNNTAKYDHQIHLEILPEPYTGDPEANIVLLNLNPGFYERNETFLQDNTYEYFAKTNKSNLIHGYQEYPFYHLDPNNIQSPGYYWWSRKLKQLISHYGSKRVASEICNFEYFPYHSQHFGCGNLIIESQKYTFHLVEEALRRNAIVILMRGRNYWEREIPRLREHPYYTLNSAQSASISEKNCPKGYHEILKLLG